MEQDPDSPPTNRRRTPPIDPVVLIILIPILALIFLPPFLSHFSHILKPGSLKSTWDSLNIFLVLFAILCGVFARQNDDGSSSSSSGHNNNIGVQSSSQWVGFPDRKVGLRRNSSSYPNLRHESVWENGDIRNRFYDDFDVDLYSSPATRYYNNHLSHREREDLYRRRSEADPVDFSQEKEIVVDTFQVRPNAPEFRQQPPVTTVPSPPPVPPPPPPPPTSAPPARQSFRSVGKNVNVEASPEVDKSSYYTPPLPPPPPAPPSTDVRIHRSRHKHKKLERKVSDATKEIATAISSLYNQSKRKNKRQLRNNSGSSDSSPPSLHSIRSETEQLQQPLPPPPPPPPPPPHSRFQNLFKKGSKQKKIHSVPAIIPLPPPPPPPPPPSSIFNNLLKSVSKSKRFHNFHSSSSIMNISSKTGTKSNRFNSITAAYSPPAPPAPRYTKSKQIEHQNRRSTSKGKPPLPTKSSSYYDRDEFVASGSQSPLIPMPPPPPPFKVSAMKFELRGDFVRVRSTHSSVCSSPDRDYVDFNSTMMDGGGSSGPGVGSGSGLKFFPSPDVNAKAETFISRLKDEWRMEKNKS